MADSSEIERLLATTPWDTCAGPVGLRALFERLKFVARAFRLAPPAPAGAGPRLLRADGDERIVSIGIPAAGLEIGRTAGCGLVLASPRASRRHAIVRATPGGAEIEDLGSSNGTRVNGEPLAAHAPRALRDGDFIEIGGVPLVVALHRGLGYDR